MLQITRKNDARQIKAIPEKVADLPNGVTVATADLGGSVLPEGTPVGLDSETGLYHAIKTARVAVAAESTATVYTVKKGHNFKVGDFIMTKAGAAADAITAIATNASDPTLDDITVAASIGAAAVDSVLEAAQAKADAGAITYEPKGIVGEAYDIVSGSNILANVWVVAVAKESLCAPASDDIKAALKGIIYY